MILMTSPSKPRDFKPNPTSSQESCSWVSVMVCVCFCERKWLLLKTSFCVESPPRDAILTPGLYCVSNPCHKVNLLKNGGEVAEVYANLVQSQLHPHMSCTYLYIFLFLGTGIPKRGRFQLDVRSPQTWWRNVVANTTSCTRCCDIIRDNVLISSAIIAESLATNPGQRPGNHATPDQRDQMMCGRYLSSNGYKYLNFWSAKRQLLLQVGDTTNSLTPASGSSVNHLLIYHPAQN
jgi:hypothetical protein